LEEYESHALRLATRPRERAALRQKLARHRSTLPLFDIGRFTLNFEAA